MKQTKIKERLTLCGPEWVFFILGVTAGPFVGSILRASARTIVRAGFLATREIERVYAEVREDVADARAEARSAATPRPSATTHTN
jgi:hypothetical protein